MHYALFAEYLMHYLLKALEPATLIPLQLLKQMQAKCVMVRISKQSLDILQFLLNMSSDAHKKSIFEFVVGG